MGENMGTRRHLKGLYSTDARVRWRAVRALGAHLERTWSESPGPARELLRRLAWSLNEESGATGWGAPEAMGEIMARVPELAEHFPGRFTAYLSHEEVFLDNEVLDAGAIWALGRLQGVTGEGAAEVGPELPRFLEHPAPSVRGVAAWTAGRLRVTELRERLTGLVSDDSPLVLLIGEEVAERTVGELARWALEELDEAGEAP
jgi:hypothetical protein